VNLWNLWIGNGRGIIRGIDEVENLIDRRVILIVLPIKQSSIEIRPIKLQGLEWVELIYNLHMQSSTLLPHLPLFD
jgi:hypothetical protein